jgi:hypothetical protein
VWSAQFDDTSHHKTISRLLVNGLFNSAVSSSAYIASNGRISNVENEENG